MQTMTGYGSEHGALLASVSGRGDYENHPAHLLIDGVHPCHDDGLHSLRATPSHSPTGPERSAGLAAAIRQ